MRDGRNSSFNKIVDKAISNREARCAYIEHGIKQSIANVLRNAMTKKKVSANDLSILSSVPASRIEKMLDPLGSKSSPAIMDICKVFDALKLKISIELEAQ